MKYFFVLIYQLTCQYLFIKNNIYLVRGIILLRSERDTDLTFDSTRTRGK